MNGSLYLLSVQQLYISTAAVTLLLSIDLKFVELTADILEN